MPNYKVGIEVDAQAGDSARDIGKVDGAVSDLSDALDGGARGAGGFGDALGGLLSPAGLATGALLAVGGAMMATGAHAMELARDVEDSTALMTTQLGLTSDQAEGFEEVMRSIYENNYGESFSDIAESLVVVDQQFARIGHDSVETYEGLQRVTEMAIAFSDAFDTDVAESTSAVVTLMENFGLSATQAFDFLVAGQQRGLNSSGDFLDTIGEYSVQFNAAGATAGEFFSILETGNAGGVLGTDKITDAFKEFTIRIVDDSTTTRTALEGIGISYDELKQGFADGSVTQVQALQMVIDKIGEIEDPIERNRIGVALFGTQWEDATDQVITGIDLQRTAMEDLEGTNADLFDQYETGAAQGEAATREWENALVDLGVSLNSLKTATIPALTWVLETTLIPAVSLLADFIDNLVEGQGVWDSFINGLWSLAPDINWGRGPQAQAQSLSFDGGGGIALPSGVGPSAQSLAGAAVYQTFYIERGDAETVSTSAELGVTRAQRAIGQ